MINITLNPIVAQLLPPIRKEALIAAIAANEEAQASKTDDERRAIIAAAHAPNADPRLRAELAAAREKVIRLNVWAENIVMALFASEDLADDEWIQIINRRDQKFNVLETHTHGMAPKQSFAVEHDTERYRTDRYSTGVVEYPTEDGLLGRLDVADEVNRDLTREWEAKIDDHLDGLIDGAISASWTDGTTYVRDARFAGGTLPTTNQINHASGNNAFTFEIFKDAVEHFDLLPGKSLRLIRLNPTEMRDTWGWQHEVMSYAAGLPTGYADPTKLITTRIKDDILKAGRPTGQILGREVTYLLDPTYKKNYIQIYSNEPVGTFYEKPGLSKIIDLDEVQMMAMFQKENMRGVLQSGHWKGLVYGPDGTNVAEIQFV